MDGKLVYSSKMHIANPKAYETQNVTGTCAMPDADYVEIAFIERYTKTINEYPIAVASDYGTYRVARGGNARVKVTESFSADASFSSDGTLSVTVFSLQGSGSANGSVTFNVFGYKYPA